MALVDGINHVAFVTADFDRLSAFYERLFEADVVMDMSNGVRHGMIRLGPSCALHAFEFKSSEWTKPGQQMFRRGRLDHIAINCTSREAFDTLRQRLMDEGATDGTITDFGALLNVFFVDPDGMEAEICFLKDDWSASREPEGFRPRHPLPSD